MWKSSRGMITFARHYTSLAKWLVKPLICRKDAIEKILNVQVINIVESEAYCFEPMIHTEDVEIFSSHIFLLMAKIIIEEVRKKYQPDWIFCSHLIPFLYVELVIEKACSNKMSRVTLRAWIKAFKISSFFFNSRKVLSDETKL